MQAKHINNKVKTINNYKPIKKTYRTKQQTKQPTTTYKTL